LLVKWPHRAVGLRSDNEGFWLSQLADLATLEPLRSSFPRLLAGGLEAGVMVLDAVAECRTLREAVADGAGPPAEWWARFAATLGMLHAIDVPDDVRSDANRQLNLPLPASFHLTTEEYALGCGDGFGHYVASIQAASEELTRLRLGWQASALIHFDLTGDNVLIEDSSSGSPLRIVDWELAGLGDPMYDVGSLLSHLLGNAMRSGTARFSKHGAPGAGDAGLRHAKRFLISYQDATNAGDDELMRACRYVGLCQFLSALGRLERIGSLGRIGNLSLLIGQRVLRHPDLLLGLLLDRRP
jgi:hypothetical protein